MTIKVVYIGASPY